MSFISRPGLVAPIRRSLGACRMFASTSIAGSPYRDGPMRIEDNPFTRSDFPKPPRPSSKYTEKYGDGAYSNSSAGPTSSSRYSGVAEPMDPHDWWKSRAAVTDPTREVQVVSKLHGRSFPVRRGADFNPSYRNIKRLMNETGVKQQMRLGEYYEKPSEKRVRISSGRWRTRFAAMVREKVHEAELYRKRQ